MAAAVFRGLAKVKVKRGIKPVARYFGSTTHDIKASRQAEARTRLRNNVKCKGELDRVMVRRGNTISNIKPLAAKAKLSNVLSEKQMRSRVCQVS